MESGVTRGGRSRAGLLGGRRASKDELLALAGAVGAGFDLNVFGEMVANVDRMSVDGLGLSGRFCHAGELKAAESPTTVRLTYFPGVIEPGAGACAAPVVRAQLAMPLGKRALVDGISGQPIAVTVAK